MSSIRSMRYDFHLQGAIKERTTPDICKNNRKSIVKAKFDLYNITHNYMVVPGTNYQISSSVTEEKIRTKRVQVLADKITEAAFPLRLANALTSMEVPQDQQHEQIRSFLSEAKRLLETGRSHGGSCTISIAVRIQAIGSKECAYDDDVAQRIVKADIVWKMIESLEKVVINRDQDGNCAVCMVGFKVGKEAARTPCSHVFHLDCIKGWLKVSNACPLCRYELA